MSVDSEPPGGPQRVVPGRAAEAGERLMQGNPGIAERFRGGLNKVGRFIRGSGSTEPAALSRAAEIIPLVELSPTPVAGTAEAETSVVDSRKKTVLKPSRWDDRDMVSSGEESGSEPGEPAAGEGVTGPVSAGEQGLVPTVGQDTETGPRAEQETLALSEELAAEPSAPAATAPGSQAAAQDRPVNRPDDRPVSNPLSFLDPFIPSEPAAAQSSSSEKPPLDLSQPVKVGGTPEELEETAQQIVAKLKASGSADTTIPFEGTPGNLGTLRELLAKAGITPNSQSKPVFRDGILSVTATFSPPAAPESPAQAAAEPAGGVGQSESAAATGPAVSTAESLEVSSASAEPASDASSSAAGETSELTPQSPEWPISLEGRTDAEIEGELKRRLGVLGSSSGQIVLSGIPDSVSQSEEYMNKLNEIIAMLNAQGRDTTDLISKIVTSADSSGRIMRIPILERQSDSAAAPGGEAAVPPTETVTTSDATASTAAAEPPSETAQPAEEDADAAAQAESTERAIPEAITQVVDMIDGEDFSLRVARNLLAQTAGRFAGDELTPEMQDKLKEEVTRKLDSVDSPAPRLLLNEALTKLIDQAADLPDMAIRNATIRDRIKAARILGLDESVKGLVQTLEAYEDFIREEEARASAT